MSTLFNDTFTYPQAQSYQSSHQNQYPHSNLSPLHTLAKQVRNESWKKHTDFFPCCFCIIIILIIVLIPLSIYGCSPEFSDTCLFYTIKPARISNIYNVDYNCTKCAQYVYVVSNQHIQTNNETNQWMETTNKTNSTNSLIEMNKTTHRFLKSKVTSSPTKTTAVCVKVVKVPCYDQYITYTYENSQGFPQSCTIKTMKQSQKITNDDLFNIAYYNQYRSINETRNILIRKGFETCVTSEVPVTEFSSMIAMASLIGFSFCFICCAVVLYYCHQEEEKSSNIVYVSELL